MSIQVLSSDVVNQISAGEVVEKPAHLVKELVENGIDAGATEITVDIAFGGRRVRVQDDGDGIRANELAIALERHATSKIRASDDLWNLQSFGFRGEALASIAAVAKVTIQSSHKVEKNPSQILSTFGQVGELRSSSRTKGTEITVDDLFSNVPARLKFLKSDFAEVQAIKTVIKATALAHPNIQFKLTVDDSLQFFFARKSNLLERAQEVLEKPLFVASSSRGSIQVEVVFSSPQEIAKTAKQIWIFAQNRFIQDRALQAAIMDSYRSLLMHGEYPFVVCKVSCAPQEIDVNIHPTKSQVKFQDASSVFRAVHGALREALEKAPWIKRNQMQEIREDRNVSSFMDSTYTMISTPVAMSFQDHTFKQTQFKQKNFSPENVTREIQYDDSHYSSETSYWGSMQVLGQANLTYIICQKNDRLIYVDQHAAHERVAFESLMKSWKEKRYEIQEYLFPFVVDLTEEKIEALLKMEPTINDLGITIERLGPLSLGIKSAPSLIKDSALVRAFDKLAIDLVEYGGSFAIEKSMGDIFATMACHSVVRAGQSLSLEQMQQLLKSMDEFALSSFCPHGRPVSVETTFLELEKQFGRIN